MSRRAPSTERPKRRWVILTGTLEESDELDLRYWLDHTTGAERVLAVHACLVDALRTKGARVPGFRRVHRFVERPQGSLPRGRRLRRRVSRPTAEPASYIGLEDLIHVKELAGRPVDLEDVRVLTRVLRRRRRAPS